MASNSDLDADVEETLHNKEISPEDIARDGREMLEGEMQD